MKQLIIHIGSPKTGSTAIQHALTDARDSLKSSGVTYPRGLNAYSSHNEILDAVIRDPKKWGRTIRTLYGESDSEQIRYTQGNTFINELRASQRVILSAEALFHYSTEDVEKLLKLCSECGFDEPFVIAYLRDPAQLYLSHTQTKLRGSAKFKSPFDFHIRYCSILRRWAKMENVRLEVLPYNSGIDVVSHFAQIINDHMNTQAGENLRGRPDSNHSVSAEAMIFLQDYMKQFRAADEDRLSKEVLNLINVFSKLNASSVKQTEPQAKPWVIAKITENNRSEIDALRAEFGVSLPSPSIVEGDYEIEVQDGSKLDIRDILSDWNPDTLYNLLIHSLHELASIYR